MKPHFKYRPDIDGLRAIAVLAVVVFHAHPAWLPGGFIGVDVFFVISGFLISSIIFDGLESGSFSFLHFYVRRILRIFPPLIIVLAFCLVVGGFILLRGEYAQLTKHMVAAVAFVVNVVFRRESGYFEASSESKPLLHLWSLCIEEQFYVLWPLTLFLVWRRAGSKLRLMTPVVLVAIFAASFYANVVTTKTDPGAAFFLAQNRIWELVLGALLASFSLKGDSMFHRLGPLVASAASFIGWALLLAGFRIIARQVAFPGYWALIPTMGAWLLIAAGPAAWVNRTLLASPVVVWVGLFSYPLYLWHWPVLSFVSILQNSQPTELSKALAVALSFVLAWASNRFIERRIRFAQKPTLRAWAMPLALVVAMVSIGGISLRLNTMGERFEPIEIGVPTNGPNKPFVQDIEGYVAHIEGWRQHRCFIEKAETAQNFADDCVDTTPVLKPLILLWGDSNAASLASGIRGVLENAPYRFAQFTSSACPPVLSEMVAERANCKGVNDAVYDKLFTLKPDIVLLSGQSFGDEPEALELMKKSTELVRLARPRRVIWLGPSPRYSTPLPAYLAREFRDVPTIDIPRRVKLPIDQATKDRDKKLAQMAKENGIEFISLIDVLCDAEGCIVRVPFDAGHDDVTQFDVHHLSAAGSRFVSEAIAPVLLDAR